MSRTDYRYSLVPLNQQLRHDFNAMDAAHCGLLTLQQLSDSLENTQVPLWRTVLWLESNLTSFFLFPLFFFFSVSFSFFFICSYTSHFSCYSISSCTLYFPLCLFSTLQGSPDSILRNDVDVTSAFRNMCVEHVRRSDRAQLCESHHSMFNGYENIGTLQSDLSSISLDLDASQNKCSDRIRKYYKIRGKNPSHSHSNSGGNISGSINDEYGGGSEVPSRSGLNLVRSLSKARRGRRGSDGSNSNINSNSNNDINSGSGARRGGGGDGVGTGRGGAEGGSSSSPKVNSTTENSTIPSPNNTNSTPSPDGHGVLTFREYVTVSMIGRYYWPLSLSLSPHIWDLYLRSCVWQLKMNLYFLQLKSAFFIFSSIMLSSLDFVHHFLPLFKFEFALWYLQYWHCHVQNLR